MKICSIVFLCIYCHALNLSENKYYFITLENQYETMYEKFDNYKYHKIVSSQFETYACELNKLETISPTDTSPGDEINCRFMKNILDLFDTTLYLWKYTRSNFSSYDARITMLLIPKICKILKAFNKSEITFPELKSGIIKVIEKEINDSKLQPLKAESYCSWSQNQFIHAFYKNGLFTEETVIEDYHSLILHPETKKLESILKDKMKYEFIKRKKTENEKKTLFDLFDEFYELINEKCKDLTTKKGFIYIDFDVSLLVLDYFLELKNEYENLLINKENLLLKLIIYIHDLSEIVNVVHLKKYYSQILSSKNHIKLCFFYDGFCFFFEYVNFYFNDFFEDFSIESKSFSVITDQCRELCYKVREIT